MLGLNDGRRTAQNLNGSAQTAIVTNMTSMRPGSTPSPSFALPTARQFLVVLVIIVLLSWFLHVVTSTDFAKVVSRIGFVGIALLLAYTTSSRIRQRFVPQPMIRLLAVGLMAPLASFASFSLSANGDVIAYLSTPKHFFGFVILSIVALFFGAIVTMVALRLERKARERADRLQIEIEKNTLERQLLDARLRLLQAQIEPHFLFNTLANIEALVASRSDNAAPVLRHLIAYLRAAMPRLGDADATLDTELQLVRAYLELMRMRMPDRLQFDVSSVPQLSQLRFPAMSLLTLVENAVRHGIDPSLAGGRIDIEGKVDCTSGIVTLSVTDTGVGMSENAQAGTGLSNVRTRLQAIYGPDARLDLHEATPHGLRVEIVFRPGSQT